MIDLHFHCLPAIDDGPPDWDSAVALCRAAADEGTHTIVATPHVLRGEWLNDNIATRRALVAELNQRLGGSPRIVSGCEYFFSSDAIELWENAAAGPLEGLGGGSYLLLEFPAASVPSIAEAVFHEFFLMGVHPVIAHPERNLGFSREPQRLEALVRRGALIQITAGSLTGAMGKPALMAANRLFERGLVHVIASDAHSIDRRPPALASAREVVRKTWGSEVETQIFDTNPQAILESRTLNMKAAESS